MFELFDLTAVKAMGKDQGYRGLFHTWEEANEFALNNPEMFRGPYSIEELKGDK